MQGKLLFRIKIDFQNSQHKNWPKSIAIFDIYNLSILVQTRTETVRVWNTEQRLLSLSKYVSTVVEINALILVIPLLNRFRFVSGLIILSICFIYQIFTRR